MRTRRDVFNRNYLMWNCCSKSYRGKSSLPETSVKRGEDAERRVLEQLSNCPNNYAIFHDYNIYEDERLICQIDDIVVNENGIFVIEVKGNRGCVFRDGNKWKVRLGKDNVRDMRRSPGAQNYYHIKVLKRLINKYMFSVLVFDNKTYVDINSVR